jgi:redox-sensitive bicupin YhaK (pirin superfamily)
MSLKSLDPTAVKVPRKIIEYHEVLQTLKSQDIVSREIISLKDHANSDPFIHIDHFKVPNSYTYSPHPHRGHDKLTYILSGEYTSRDFCSNQVNLSPGEFQYLQAGRGLVHEETVSCNFEGLSIWINVENKYKLSNFSYQNRKLESITEVDKEGVHVSVLVGTYDHINSDIINRTPANIFDISIRPNATFEHYIHDDWNCFVYVIEGSIETQEIFLPRHFVGFFTTGGRYISFRSSIGARVLLCAGEPIDECVFMHEGFVMTSERGVLDSIAEYKSSIHGFESEYDFLQLES